MARRGDVERDGPADPARVPDRVGALDDADVERGAGVSLDAEIGGLARLGDQLLHRRPGEVDERLVGQCLRAELDEAAARPVRAAELFLA